MQAGVNVDPSFGHCYPSPSKISRTLYALPLGGLVANGLPRSAHENKSCYEPSKEGRSGVNGIGHEVPLTYQVQ